MRYRRKELVGWDSGNLDWYLELGFVVRVKDPTSKFFGLGQGTIPQFATIHMAII